VPAIRRETKLILQSADIQRPCNGYSVVPFGAVIGLGRRIVEKGATRVNNTSWIKPQAFRQRLSIASSSDTHGCRSRRTAIPTAAPSESTRRVSYLRQERGLGTISRARPTGWLSSRFGRRTRTCCRWRFVTLVVVKNWPCVILLYSKVAVAHRIIISVGDFTLCAYQCQSLRLYKLPFTRRRTPCSLNLRGRTHPR
jgi:hypothetical protein